MEIPKKDLPLYSQNNGAVAQMVEQWTENPCVGSSILPSTTNYTDNQLVTNLRTTFTHNGQEVVRFLWLKNSRVAHLTLRVHSNDMV